jgi:hypothetical protein
MRRGIVASALLVCVTVQAAEEDVFLDEPGDRFTLLTETLARTQGAVNIAGYFYSKNGKVRMVYSVTGCADGRGAIYIRMGEPPGIKTAGWYWALSGRDMADSIARAACTMAFQRKD